MEVAELLDRGNWGNDMIHCSAKTYGAEKSSGSPMIIFKSDLITYDFKNLSVREITLHQDSAFEILIIHINLLNGNFIVVLLEVITFFDLNSTGAYYTKTLQFGEVYFV